MKDRPPPPASPQSEALTDAQKLLPHEYLLAKLAMVMPLFQEARDALPAITVTAARLHGVRLDLGNRMDVAGTFSIDDWQRDFPERALPQVAGAPVSQADALDAKRYRWLREHFYSVSYFSEDEVVDIYAFEERRPGQWWDHEIDAAMSEPKP